MKQIRQILYPAMLLCSLVLLVSCLKTEKIPIAIMTKLESGSIVGTSEINAAKLYLEDNSINNIDIVPFNDGWDPQKAKEAFRQLKKQGIRILITSHISTCALAIENDINKSKILTMITGATTNKLTKKDDYILRVIQDVADEQKSIADYVNSHPATGVIIVRDIDNDAYTTPALQYFRAGLKKPIVSSIDIHISNPDLVAVSRSLPAGGNVIVYLLIGGYNIAAGSLAQIINRTLPTATILFTPWMKTPTLLENLGDAVNRSVMPSHYPPRGENRTVDRYILQYKKRFGYAPTFISINVYTALEILCDAIRAGHTEPDDIKRYIIGKKMFKTNFYNIEFDRYGDIHRHLYFITDLTKEF